MTNIDEINHKKSKKVLTKAGSGGIINRSQARDAEMCLGWVERMEKSLRNFQKPIDKANRLWYNIQAVNEKRQQVSDDPWKLNNRRKIVRMNGDEKSSSGISTIPFLKRIA